MKSGNRLINWNEFGIKTGIILLITFFAKCGLFEKRFPPAGEFCDVLEKPPVCIFVDFENRILRFSPDEVYPLEVENRVNYSYFKSPQEKEKLQVLTEHRVKLSNGKFYLRKKTKKNR